MARRLGLPDAVAFVVPGVAGSAVPGVPDVHLSSDVVLLVLLPPLIFFAGFFSDARLVRANFGPVSGLALYESRLERLRRRIDGDDLPESGAEVHMLRLRLLAKQREALARLYQNDEVGAYVPTRYATSWTVEEARLRRRQ